MRRSVISVPSIPLRSTTTLLLPKVLGRRMPGGETTGKIWEEAAKGEARNDGVEEAIKEETFGAPQQEEIAEQEALQSEPKDDGADNAEERIEEEKNIVEPHAHSEEEEAPFDGEKKEEE